MNRPIRIGSRDSDLALWQANTVRKMLHDQGVPSEIVPVKSEGDLDAVTPLYELGIIGIFTRTLDLALIQKRVDIAVHSMKDVPTSLPKGVVNAAVLKRANPYDVLIHKGLDFLNTEGILATGSLRRKAQWLNRYPLHEIVDLRGNVPTRLKKLGEQPWNGAILAAAGLERLGHQPENSVELQWMIPAPAQGAILVAARENSSVLEKLNKLNDPATELCTRIEREFLKELEGGCSAPIGALAEISGDTLQFKGVLASLNGHQLLRLEDECSLADITGWGERLARKILSEGGREIMDDIKHHLNK